MHHRFIILVGAATMISFSSAPDAFARKGQSTAKPPTAEQLKQQADQEQRRKEMEAGKNWHQRTHLGDQWASTSRGSIYAEAKYGAERLDWRVVSPRYVDKAALGPPHTLYLAFDGKAELSGMLIANVIEATTLERAKQDLDPIGTVYLGAPGTGKIAAFDVGPITTFEAAMGNGRMRKYFIRPLTMKADKVAMLAALPDETKIELWWGSSRKPDPAKDFQPFTKHLDNLRPAAMTAGYVKYMLDVIRAGK